MPPYTHVHAVAELSVTHLPATSREHDPFFARPTLIAATPATPTAANVLDPMIADVGTRAPSSRRCVVRRRLIADRGFFERAFGCLSFRNRLSKRDDSFLHLGFARSVLAFFEIMFERFERFFFALQSIRSDTDVVLKLASTTQPIRVSKVNQRALIVGLLERHSTALEVLARRRVVRRLLRHRRHGPNEADQQHSETRPTMSDPPALPS